jgi:hypothetical protein
MGQPLASIGPCVVLALVMALGAIGRLVRSDRTAPVFDIVVGWGVFYSIVISVGSTLGVPFSQIYAVLAVPALLCLAVVVRRRTLPGGAAFWGCVALISPLLYGIFAGLPFDYDDLTHWLPNAQYLFRNDLLPGFASEPPVSVWPFYPYGEVVLIHIVSLAFDGIVEQTGPALHVVWVMLYAGLLADITRNPTARSTVWGTLRQCVWALFLTLPLNPAFHRSTMLSSMSDLPTAVILAFATFATWQQTRRLLSGETRQRPFVYGEWIALTAALTLLIHFRQSNIVFVALLAIGQTLALLRIAGPHRVADIRIVVVNLLVPVCVYLVWRRYVGTYSNGQEFQFLPLADWHFALLGDFVISAWNNAISERPVLYALYVFVIGAGLYHVVHRPTQQTDLLIIGGTLVGGYLSFLLVCYMGASFSEDEVRIAASFHRYTNHVGYAAYLIFVLAVTPAARTLRMPPLATTMLRAVGSVLVLAIPLALAIVPERIVKTRHLPQIAAARYMAWELVTPGQSLRVLNEGGPVAAALPKYWLQQLTARRGSMIDLDFRPARADQIGDETLLIVDTRAPDVWQALSLPVQDKITFLQKDAAGDWQIIAVPQTYSRPNWRPLP